MADPALMYYDHVTGDHVTDVHVTDSSLRYYELSLMGGRQDKVDPEELLQSLNYAITCTVLAPAGGREGGWGHTGGRGAMPLQ